MIAVVGLSHKTAPIDIRERAALAEDALSEFLRQLAGVASVSEAMVVSTCNRVEVVVAPRERTPHGLLEAQRDVSRTLTDRIPGVGDHLYQLVGDVALRHLFRVAASLDSLVMGEPQILGQVKGALSFAREVGTVGPELNRAVGHAVRTAKRVRSETAVGAGQVSVPSVALELAGQIFGQLEGRTAVLIGAGAMGEAAAKLFCQAGSRLLVVGRNREHTERLCQELGGSPRGLDELPQTLWDADVVVTATSASGYVVDFEMMQKVHRRRRGRSLFLIDLAVPRDVDPRVHELGSVFLYNIDDLSEQVTESLSSRQREAERAELIIENEAQAFERSLSAEQATPTVVALRAQFSALLRGELERSLKGRLKHLSADDRAALEKMVDASINKMLHPATRTLRRLAADKEATPELDGYVAVLRELFELDAASQTNAASRTDAALQPSPASQSDGAPSLTVSQPPPSDDDAEVDAEPAAREPTKLTKVG